MRGLEKIGGWILVAGGAVFLFELLSPRLRQFEGLARMAVAVGAGLFIVGHVV